MRIRQSLLICFAMVFVFLVMAVGTVAAIEIHVYPGDSIQSAINAATDGNTIIVYPGTYTENVDVDKELTIKSQSGNPSDTIVQAASSTDHVFHVTADYVTISGFNVTGANFGWPYSGIYLAGLFENCNISNNDASYNYYGIYLTGSYYNELNNNNASYNYYGIHLEDSYVNELSNNIASDNKYGIRLSHSSNNNLTSNTVLNNDDGIYLYHSNANELNNNNANSNKDSGIHLEGTFYNTLNNNIASYNDGNGILLQESNYDNIIYNNTASNNDANGILLQYSNANELNNNNASNNYCGIYLDESCSENTLINNIASYNDDYGIYLRRYNYYNIIYNNYFNNTNNAYISTHRFGNVWNTTNSSGPNIIGGPFLGGNCWAKPDGRGFSQLVVNLDGDGFCDWPYVLLDANNIDYLPLYMPKTITVDDLRDDCPDADYTTIQAAIDNVITTDGDTIIVYPGTYTENVDVYKRLNITSTGGAAVTHVTAASPGDHVFEVTADWVTITGFNVSSATDTNKAGIWLSWYSTNNNLTSNTASDNYYGILLVSSSNNTLTSNTASGNYRGIYLEASSNNNLTSNKVLNNTGSGIRLSSSSNNFIYNNHFNNTANTFFTGTNTNNVWNTTNSSGPNIVEGPYLGGNYWATPYNDGFSQTCVDVDVGGNDICDVPYWIASGHVDYLPLAAPAATITVADDLIQYPDADYTSIQDAVEAPTTFNGYTILVYPGTYYENVNVNKQLNITSTDGAAVTHVTAASSSDHVFEVTADWVTISGFKVSGASGSGKTGIYLWSSSNSTLTSNMVSNNDNGIVLNDSSNNNLTSNTVSDNLFGINLRSSSNNNNLTSNTVLNNYNGIYLRDSSNNNLTSNTVLNNDDGIYLYHSNDNLIYNNHFNNTDNTDFRGTNTGNDWNTIETEGTNIMGGHNLGGNFWATPYNDGFSQTNVDTNDDGFCDSPLNKYAIHSNNIDFLPLADTLTITGTCPVDLEVVDPEGLIINKQTNQIPGATYTETDINGDGDSDDRILIPAPKPGNYQIKIIPEPDAEPTDTYTLEVSTRGTSIILCKEVTVGDIPDQPYTVEVTDEGVYSFLLPPVADFTANVTSGKAPMTVQFTDFSSNATSWEWDVNGDGIVDYTTRNPIHTYDMPGIYDVSLNASNLNGSHTETKIGYISVEEYPVLTTLLLLTVVVLGIAIVLFLRRKRD
ncbi:NosD domain-containing protein [Methanococcoides vulcani]|uniref:NosD domain-containing protein n=1 Tax=Methanococcoides vulcani TaxID=1353158 RepID=UPI000AD611D6|nr:NosD domain-containing protein [Methanococcoides vulcani]